MQTYVSCPAPTAGMRQAAQQQLLVTVMRGLQVNVTILKHGSRALLLPAAACAWPASCCKERDAGSLS